MAQQLIGLGTVANDGTGNPLRTGGQKINDNFTELYGRSTPRYTWTGKPASGTLGDRIIITDVGTSEWIAFWNGTRWMGAHTVDLGGTIAPITGTASATIQKLFSTTAKAGVMLGFRRLRLYIGGNKSGGTDSVTVAIKLGTADTSADTTLRTNPLVMATGSRSFGIIYDFGITSATSILPLGQAGVGGSYGGTVAVVALAAVSVTDTSANDEFVGIYLTMSGATDTPTLNTISVELIP